LIRILGGQTRDRNLTSLPAMLSVFILPDRPFMAGFWCSVQGISSRHRLALGMSHEKVTRNHHATVVGGLATYGIALFLMPSPDWLYGYGKNAEAEMEMEKIVRDSW
jgi:hypothetical protein